MSQFTYLFSPIKVGSITIRNRIMSTGHMTEMGADLIPTQRMIDYHVERAKGGIGLIVLEAGAVHPTALWASRDLGFFDERIVAGLRPLTEAVHREGAAVFAQLFHPGREMFHGDMGLPAAAPSSVPTQRFRIMPKELEAEEIREIIESYGEAARRAKDGGCDGVELVSSHGYLLNQFWSPRNNLRTDEYGGSFENRMRFAVEVAEAVRSRVGSDYPVGLRISGDELVEGGMTLPEMEEVIAYLNKVVSLDFINVTAGSSSTYLGATAIAPPAPSALGIFSAFSAAIRELVDIPVFLGTRINDPLLAEKILSEGQADVVGMTRALICDPHMPNKAASGRLEEIRYCVGCNQGCIGRHQQGLPVTCIQTPSSGRERDLGVVSRAEKPKKLVVVGGGPAGLRAAITAAERGHQVILYEKASALGGQVLLAAKAPGREEFQDIVRNLESELQRQNVEVRLGTEASAELIERDRPDVVIIATGARPYYPPIPGIEQDNVVCVADAIEGTAEIGRSVLVADWMGDMPAINAAELLADRGHEVELASTGLYIGEGLQSYQRSLAHQRFYEKKIGMRPHHVLKEIQGNTVILENIFSFERHSVDGVDTVVLAMGQLPNDGLYKALKGKVAELYRVGDCVVPRTVEEAIYEGYTTALKV
ncbi:MAG: FAD-dependent oxidoreductase [Chloroflexi bacterium]|nr:FAD-dependent oxidoreductase [Chloroflexota bacterium]